ncbi:ABC transporter permease subunit [Brasilonema sp. UFV-L1]|uniref:ABC transporter permease subunit n=1 Tax=Brasilonema sp. UFV-L1 TaxID=2234130 RepID=UPI00145C9C0F|nr:ABC transporter permease subunit [Brasilonema sp. UFV-L1]NMG09280.1 ABC transporter permease [Brasilonema sp. UFV-L1]
MVINFIDKLGDWNPQLLRELKGRLKVFPTVIAVVTSLLLQLIVFLYQLREIPVDKYRLYDTYCKLGLNFEQARIKLQTELSIQYQQLQEQFRLYSSSSDFDQVKLEQVKSQIADVREQQNNIYQTLNNQLCPLDKIDMQMWWRDHWGYIFLSLSVIFIFTLLVAGTYLLIDNLATEERRGTLNFIRLTPQSETSILTGKILGVPILIYLVVFAAIPLHFIAGRAANIATSYIFSFWAVLVACCMFFYSAALLFGLCCRWFSGFQPWLGSGAVLIFLFITIGLASSNSNIMTETGLLRIFSPFDITNYLFPKLFNTYNGAPLEKLQFFNLHIGKTVVGIVSLHLLNYGLWTYWIWQALKRCFRNPNSTLLSKGQSYLWMACLQIINFGFYFGIYQSTNELTLYDMQRYLTWLYPFNLLVFLGLIEILSPHRQTVQDWIRYRHQDVTTTNSYSRKNSLLEDLIWGEKSPAVLAIAINLVIATTPVLVGILLWYHPAEVNLINMMKSLLAVALFISLIMIYATLTQLMLLMKTPKRAFWAFGTTTTAMFLPPILFGVLGISAYNTQSLWLLTSFSWMGISEAATTTIFMALLAQLSILALLNFQLIRQARLVGESATKALLAER